ncbi:MAG: 23S rRNA pseudouridine2605 synthase [Pseudohongiellaceae bacterium]|jgi:23S rRNA pseudouridine2605 synthase
MVRQRLQKVMAACGAGSRRQCETFIADGRVQVDGKVIQEPGTLVDPETQELRFDFEVLSMPTQLYYLLHKPSGVICSQRISPEMPRAIDFAPKQAGEQRLFTIGRLDVESEGALILTNDGELCHLVTHPRFQIEKTYLVQIEGVPDGTTIERMRKGVWLAEGRTNELNIKVVSRERSHTILQMKLNEGMKREIRRVCARFGHEVRRLVRTSIGPIELGALPLGDARPLTHQEVESLRNSAQLVVRLGSPTHQNRRPARGHGQALVGRGQGSRQKGGPASKSRGMSKKSGPASKPSSSKPSASKSSGSKPASRGGPGKRPGSKPDAARPGARRGKPGGQRRSR